MVGKEFVIVFEVLVDVHPLENLSHLNDCHGGVN